MRDGVRLLAASEIGRYQFSLQLKHAPALGWRRVIKAGEMKQSMQEVKLNFRGDVRFKCSGLAGGGLRADDDFTMLKCKHVGGAGYAAEFFVQRGHSPIAYN